MRYALLLVDCPVIFLLEYNRMGNVTKYIILVYLVGDDESAPGGNPGGTLAYCAPGIGGTFSYKSPRKVITT